MVRYGLPLEVVSSDFDSAPSSPDSQHEVYRLPSYRAALFHAKKAQKEAQKPHSDMFLFMMEGYTSELRDKDRADILRPAAAETRSAERMVEEDLDDTEEWLSRQHALQNKWRAEDGAATAELNAIADGVQERMQRKLALFESAAAAKRGEIERQEAEAKAGALQKKQAAEAAAAEAARAKAAAEAKVEAERAAAKQAAAKEDQKAAAADSQTQRPAEASLQHFQEDGKTSGAAGSRQASVAQHKAAVAGSSTPSGAEKAPEPTAAAAGNEHGGAVAGPHVQVSKGAWAKLQENLKGTEALTRGDPAYTAWAEQQRKLKVTQRETRAISRSLNAIINGLAGTLEDVHDKLGRVNSELASRSGPARTEVVVQFARKVVNQCAEMVAKSPQYAWPLAALVCEVATGAPELPGVFLSIMKGSEAGCPLCVPMYVSYKVTGHELAVEDWKRQNGYREEEDEAEYLMRVSGTLRLLGAFYVHHDVNAAWSFVAAMLNAVPPNRATATALLAFLQTAGHELCCMYGRQSLKLLAYIQDHWLPALEKTGSGAAAERTQLRLFCSEGYREPPEGSRLVQSVQDAEEADRYERQSGGGRGGRGGRGGGYRNYGRR